MAHRRALAILLSVIACGSSDPSAGSSSGNDTSQGAATDPTTTITSAPTTTTQSTTSGADTSTSAPATTQPGTEDSGSSSGGPSDEVVFAVIGDFGDDFLTAIGLGAEDRVAELVASWSPDFVATVGDNNYPDGLASTIDVNIGKYYAAFIGDYTGQFGAGSPQNRFWPTLGNHDWETGNVEAHLAYFTLPGNERYYEVDYGLVHLFMVDSEAQEPDGATFDSVQGMWLQNALARSSACYKLVMFHRPGYSSGERGSEERMQWPFAKWGADAVLAGHDHSYERLEIDGIPYFVNGLGGSLRYQLEGELPESQIYFNQDWGAQLVTATPTEITFDFITVGRQLVDSWVIEKSCG